MLHIKIIAIGKLQVEAYKELEKEFQKRLKSFVHMEVIEEKEITLDNQSKEIVLKKEGDKIQKFLQNSFNIVLDVHGKQMSSEEFSGFIEKNMQYHSHITFIIGGPLGIDKSIKKQAHTLLSLSEMTFTHQMARIILQEQIYRAYTIIQNKPYHKYD